MSSVKKTVDAWSVASWDGLRRDQLRSTLAASPKQRLQWLEEAMQLAYLARQRNKQGAKRE